MCDHGVCIPLEPDAFIAVRHDTNEPLDAMGPFISESQAEEAIGALGSFVAETWTVVPMRTVRDEP